MGGRRSYPTRKFIGGSKEVNKEIGKLKEYVDRKDIENTAKQTFNVIVASRKPISYSSYSSKLFPELIKNYSNWNKITDLEFLKREISKSWSKVKQENRIIVPKEVDRIIVENAVKTVGGKK